MAKMELFTYSLLVITQFYFLDFDSADDLSNGVSLIFRPLYNAPLSEF